MNGKNILSYCKTPELIENYEAAKKDLHKGKHWKLVDGKRVWY